MNNFRRRALSSSGGLNIDPTAGRKKIGNYEVVDLGLSNGLLFATCNVGVNSETSYGSYYQWGAGDVPYGDEARYHTGGTDSSYTLPSSADTATQVMGEGWRMPTRTELDDLINKTNHKWVNNFNGSGVNGSLYISKKNPKAYVFFPAGGYIGRTGSYLLGASCIYWSSTAKNSNDAYNLDSTSNYVDVRSTGRIVYICVRGVHTAV